MAAADWAFGGDSAGRDYTDEELRRMDTQDRYNNLAMGIAADRYGRVQQYVPAATEAVFDYAERQQNAPRQTHWASGVFEPKYAARQPLLDIQRPTRPPITARPPAGDRPSRQVDQTSNGLATRVIPEDFTPIPPLQVYWQGGWRPNQQFRPDQDWRQQAGLGLQNLEEDLYDIAPDLPENPYAGQYGNGPQESFVTTDDAGQYGGVMDIGGFTPQPGPRGLTQDEILGMMDEQFRENGPLDNMTHFAPGPPEGSGLTPAEVLQSPTKTQMTPEQWSEFSDVFGEFMSLATMEDGSMYVATESEAANEILQAFQAGGMALAVDVFIKQGLAAGMDPGAEIFMNLLATYGSPQIDKFGNSALDQPDLGHPEDNMTPDVGSGADAARRRTRRV